VQADAAGDLSPNALSQTGRREFRHLPRAHNLELTALGYPLRHGPDTAANPEARIEHDRKVMSLSFDLEPRVAIVGAGRVPAPDDPGPRAALGHGDIDAVRFLGVLEGAAYRGWLTAERKTGEPPPDAMVAAVAFLRRFAGLGR
jgi:sugar phosphate isomerase/epimerase